MGVRCVTLNVPCPVWKSMYRSYKIAFSSGLVVRQLLCKKNPCLCELGKTITT